MCARCGSPAPATPVVLLPGVHPLTIGLYVAERAALAGLVLWMEARHSGTATVEHVREAEHRLALLAIRYTEALEAARGAS